MVKKKLAPKTEIPVPTVAVVHTPEIKLDAENALACDILKTAPVWPGWTPTDVQLEKFRKEYMEFIGRLKQACP